MKIFKRFIAGAVCPSCKEMDKVVIWTEKKILHRQCMACGFSDTLNEQGVNPANELPTRIDPNSTTNQPEIQVIKFYPNSILTKQTH